MGTYLASAFGIEFVTLRAASVAKTLQNLGRIIDYSHIPQATIRYRIL